MILEWITHPIDEVMCDLCRTHSHYKWIFTAGVDPFPSILYSHAGGIPMWDCIDDVSIAHGAPKHNCRCSVKVSWDFSDIENRITSLKESLKEIIEIEGKGAQIEQ